MPTQKCSDLHPSKSLLGGSRQVRHALVSSYKSRRFRSSKDESGKILCGFEAGILRGRTLPPQGEITNGTDAVSLANYRTQRGSAGCWRRRTLQRLNCFMLSSLKDRATALGSVIDCLNSTARVPEVRRCVNLDFMNGLFTGTAGAR